MNCPTSYRSYPQSEIADKCAEVADGFSSSRKAYANLLMEFPYDNIDLSDEETDVCIVHEQPDTSSNRFHLQECLGSLKQNVKEAQSAIYVRCKLLWEDYVEASTRSKWFNQENTLKVNFIGEKAVDSGGPKQELFVVRYLGWYNI